MFKLRLYSAECQDQYVILVQAKVQITTDVMFSAWTTNKNLKQISDKSSKRFVIYRSKFMTYRLYWL